MRRHGHGVPVLLCAALGACATTDIRVRKVAPGDATPGIRYSLPQPFLLVTPSPSGDGSFKVEVVYLPDESQTYAIDARTKRGKYDLDVSVKEGLLTKVAWNREDAAVAAETVRVAGEVAKAELERSAKAEAEREKKAEEKKKAAAALVAKLEAELQEKELKLKLAKAELAAAQDAKDAAAIRAASLAAAKAEIERDDALQRLEAARQEARDLAAVFNQPQAVTGATVTGAGGSGKDTFWGPMLYAIRDDGKRVRLDAVRWGPDASSPRQLPFATIAAPRPAPKPPAFSGTEPVVLNFGSQDRLEITLKLTGPVVSVDAAQRGLAKDGAPIASPPFNADLLEDGVTVRVTFTRRLEPGSYLLTLPFTYPKDLSGSLTVRIKVDG